MIDITILWIQKCVLQQIQDIFVNFWHITRWSLCNFARAFVANTVCYPLSPHWRCIVTSRQTPAIESSWGLSSGAATYTATEATCPSHSPPLALSVVTLVNCVTSSVLLIYSQPSQDRMGWLKISPSSYCGRIEIDTCYCLLSYLSKALRCE